MDDELILDPLHPLLLLLFAHVAEKRGATFALTRNEDASGTLVATMPDGTLGFEIELTPDAAGTLRLHADFRYVTQGGN